MSPHSDNQKPAVLVVDDDPSLQVRLGEALAATGFVYHASLDGASAFDAFTSVRPDIVVLDVIMPGMDGFETCIGLRQLPGGIEVPILMMTCSDDIQSIHQAFEAGATDFVTKPINHQILSYRLRYMLRTREKQIELRLSQQRLTDAQRLARLGHWEWHVVSGYVSLSTQSSIILGLDPLVGCHTINDLVASVHPKDRERVLDTFDQFLRYQHPLHVEHRVIRPDGTEAIVYQEAEAIIDESTNRLRLTGTFQDITERKRVEQRVTHLEFHDSLTNLPNRALFTTELTRIVVESEYRPNSVVAVYEVGIDQLQRLHDSLGHNYTDELIVRAAERINDALGIPDKPTEWRRPEASLLARDLSGTFLLLRPSLINSEAAIQPAQIVMQYFERPFTVADQEIFTTVSIGIAVYPADGLDASTLMRSAHTARTGVKPSGASGFCFYAQNMNDNAIERIRLEGALRKAVENEDFQLYYQPKVETTTGRPTGMEALLRWDCPDLGRVSPAKFIPIAEDLGLIVPIGEWVIREVCRQLIAWDSTGLPTLRCSINVAIQQLEIGSFERLVANILSESGVEPGRLEFELTERALMQDSSRAISVLSELRSMGCHISLDDFGTGYSSLSYLNRFPLDVVKLDRSFILDVPTDKDQSTLVAALIELAQKLRLEVVAEGVETEQQRDFLDLAGCHQIQGFLFSKPLPPVEFVDWVREHLVDSHSSQAQAI
ncbi:MAG: EAL domain-containing protein [Myxococcales bacterium]|nr:EAL domain-containing protein [Myxococcales bacterium]